MRSFCSSTAFSWQNYRSSVNAIELLQFSSFFACFPVLKLLSFSLFLLLSIFVTIIVLNDWLTWNPQNYNKWKFLLHLSTMLQANPHTFFQHIPVNLFSLFHRCGLQTKKDERKEITKNLLTKNFKFTILKPLNFFLYCFWRQTIYWKDTHKKICYKKATKNLIKKIRKNEKFCGLRYATEALLRNWPYQTFLWRQLRERFFVMWNLFMCFFRFWVTWKRKKHIKIILRD